MQINRIPSYNTNFTSKVYIANYEGTNYAQERIINDKRFQEELNKLKQNGNKDTVVFSPGRYDSIEMTVTEKNENQVKTILSPYPYLYDADSVAESYKAAKEELKNREAVIIPRTIADYII